MFMRLLGNSFDYKTCAVVDGEFPDKPDDAEGWLVTGSKHGVYDGFEWIKKLESFIRRAYDMQVPVVGICFGHQVIATALGGKVEKVGWNIGLQNYYFADQNKETKLIAWHQDQVVVPPACSTTTGSSTDCLHAELIYGKRAYSIQPHPEFTFEFASELLKSRRDGLPNHIFTLASKQLNGETHNRIIANKIISFYNS